MGSVYALVDCNNFYASCERAFDPGLAGRGVAVLSNNDGCIVARSNEVKALGIKMGVPLFQVARELEKHRVAVFSSNYALYGDMSRRVMDVLGSFSPEMEIYSIDEAFLDLGGFGHLDLDAYGRDIRDKVVRWTGIPVSVGIGRTKTLAKVANHLAKKSVKADGVLDLSDSAWVEAALERTPIGDVWGVGPGFARHLEKINVRNALQLRDVDDDWVRKRMGVTGLRTVYELRGEACYDLETAPPPRKGICSSRSFGQPIESLESLSEAIGQYITCAARKLRKQKLAAGVISVFIRTNIFKKNELRYSNCQTTGLPVATNDTGELIRYGLAGLRKIYRPGCRFKKAGVFLEQLVPETHVQGHLFDEVDREKQKRLMQAVDRINGEMAEGALRYGAVGLQQPWKTKSLRRSRRYTTRWDELPEVR
ncbi:MAG: Y-family DNA polymerase [Phycisphaerae bacterium]|nr:Y-family DNA polymerase [Phycisphaerae bacterium]